MSTPITPAQVDFSDPAVPASPAFGDVYHARAGALAQAQHVFLGGNGLPGRWQGRRCFVVLETGFGLGNNFLATWDAWRQDPARCERLVFVSVEKHPLRRDDLARAHAASPLPDLAQQLLAAWPPLTPGLHPLHFEGGRVELLLGLGDARELLRELVLQADAIYLDGFAPSRNPEMWDEWLLKQLARHAAPGTTAATWSV
ncbi:MAG: tRNA (5-methylaminomethyl-2-thiouridine)(34)-methyltransferase MnmD, partial [Roseateles sp.]